MFIILHLSTLNFIFHFITHIIHYVSVQSWPFPFLHEYLRIITQRYPAIHQLDQL